MKRYLITGATGYIGSMLVKYIKAVERDARITAIVRDREKAVRLLPPDIQLITADLTDMAAMKALEIPCDYMIHCASVTKSAEMVTHSVEVIESIVNATQNLMELARRSCVQSAVYLSSMEVYGKLRGSTGQRVTEKDCHGEVELLDRRSCYPLGKRMAENICYAYSKEYNIPVKIARLAQTFGCGILPGENRVFAQFARAAKEGRDIILHTGGGSMGNYCGIRDAVQGILLILKQGENGEAYNVVNEANTMTIREMAELVAERIAGGRIGVRCDIPQGNPYGYAPDTGLRLSGEKLMGLGWRPTQGLADMYLEMMDSLEEAGRYEEDGKRC